jgi:hypothetical protein
MQARAFWQRWGNDRRPGLQVPGGGSDRTSGGPARAGETGVEQRQTLSLPRSRRGRPRPREAVLEAGGFVGVRR